MEMGPEGCINQEPNDFCTLPEFISGIIREAIPEGQYQRRVDTMTASCCRGGQEEPRLELLPSITCSAAAGDPAKAIPVTSAWQLIRLAAKLFDDVEDGEAGDRSAELNNLATGYLFTAHAALEKLSEYGISWEQSQRVRRRFNQACLQTCAGQDMDLSTRWDRVVPTPDDWLEVARSKSGMLFAWASWAGAAVAGAVQELQDSFWEYGLRLGILVQIADDYNGIWNSSQNTDLSASRVTLPISYAHFVANPDERNALLNLLREANLGNADAASKGRDLITTLRAQMFILAAAQIQREQAIGIVKQMDLSNSASDGLLAFLNHTFPALTYLPVISNDASSHTMANAVQYNISGCQRPLKSGASDLGHH